MSVLVSVIMPVCNMAGYVGEAIDSILQQTFSDFELIIIDDASDDYTNVVVQSYTDKRIVFDRNDQNIGNYASWNRTMQKVQGKYIAIMDADFIARQDRLEKQFNYLEIHSDLLAIGSDCTFIPRDNRKDTPRMYEDILLALLYENCFVHSSLMVRVDVMRQLCGYNEDYYYSADYDLICRLALLGKVENLSEPLVQYRLHPFQISVLHQSEQKIFADEIRRNYHLAFIDCYKCQNQYLPEVAEVSFPDMGRAICYYTYARYTDDLVYEQLADTLLDEITDKITIDIPICLENGLLGIGCGFIYLLRNGFVDGNEDEVLLEIDRSLFDALVCMQDDEEIDWYGWLYYVRLRAFEEREVVKQLFGLIFKQHAVYMLDCLGRSMRRGTQLNERIDKVINEFHQKKLCPVKTGILLNIIQNTESRMVYCQLEPIQNENVTFVIPIRIDSAERERNLDILLSQLSKIENVDILIIEGDDVSCYKLKSSYQNVHYYFVQDTDPVFHRTKYLNWLLRKAESPIVGVWDTDVMVSDGQILMAVEKIRQGKAVMSFPYDGRFYMISAEKSLILEKKQVYSTLNRSLENRFLAHGPHSVGGAFLVNKEIYLRWGGENEHFYGWGPEDAERVKRMEILGLPVYRSEGPLFHLYHPRKENSWYGSQELELQNRQEFLKVCSMTREELQRYIQTWEWLPTYK